MFDAECSIQHTLRYALETLWNEHINTNLLHIDFCIFSCWITLVFSLLFNKLFCAWKIRSSSKMKFMNIFHFYSAVDSTHFINQICCINLWSIFTYWNFGFLGCSSALPSSSESSQAAASNGYGRIGGDCDGSMYTFTSLWFDWEQM